MSDETTPKPAETAPAAEAKPKAPKKEKPPALEDKPFLELMNQHFLPGLQQMLGKMGIQDVDLTLEQRELPIRGMDSSKLWQVIGKWRSGDRRQFFIIFSKEDIQAPKFFCYSDTSAPPSTLESFMIDERKVTLDLLLFYAVQRLNGQKWLVRN
ncbi:MAG TPA: DUF2996 domain-containing protein [Trichocoleus sp.]|jgi:hypothetical protein